VGSVRRRLGCHIVKRAASSHAQPSLRKFKDHAFQSHKQVLPLQQISPLIALAAFAHCIGFSYPRALRSQHYGPPKGHHITGSDPSGRGLQGVTLGLCDRTSRILPPIIARQNASLTAPHLGQATGTLRMATGNGMRESMMKLQLGGLGNPGCLELL
jgi:hypothetical protein